VLRRRAQGLAPQAGAPFWLIGIACGILSRIQTAT